MATDSVGPVGNLDGLRFDSRRVVDVTSLDDAVALAERLVAPQGRRWQHVQSVASCATQLARAASAVDSDALVAAAWLHDIGYSPEVVHTRFHPLDGARFLREAGWPETVVTLVAHHSAARFEAAERGLSAELTKFLFEPSPTQDALDTADLTTGPNGERCSFGARMHEILYRYPADDPVHRSWLRAMPTEADAVRRTQARFAAHTLRHSSAIAEVVVTPPQCSKPNCDTEISKVSIDVSALRQRSSINCLSLCALRLP